MRWRTTQFVEAIGLDFTNAALKLVYLTVEPEKLKIKQCLYIPIQMSPTRSWDTAARYALQQAVDQLNTKHRRIVIAMPDRVSFTQNLSLDENWLPHWHKSALLAAAAHLPIPIDLVYFDFQKISQPKEEPSVLGVFCRREMINSHTLLLKEAGFIPTIIEIESHALERACRYLYKLEEYPDWWVWINLELESVTILLWNKHSVLTVASDYLENSTAPKDVVSQIYPQLMRLIGSYPSSILQALWVSGSHPDRLIIETQCRQLFKIPSQSIRHLVKSNENKISEKEQSFFYTSLGLALRGARNSREKGADQLDGPPR